MRPSSLLSLLFIIAAIQPALASQTPPPGFADLVETLSPAVVNISTTQKISAPSAPQGFTFRGSPDDPQSDPFREFLERFGGEMDGEMQERNVQSLGSGFVIDPAGYIVTNNHVVEQAEEIQVLFQDESRYDAKLVGRDPKTDLALIKIEPHKKLPFVLFGDSDTMRVGDWVIAIGNPFGLGGSVSAGIISARSRNINAGPFDDFIQTDAAINRGNSGGPLFNARGEVIGVNSAIFSPSGGSVGIGFAIPSALAQPVLKQLKEHGRTFRGWLGVKIQPVTEEIAESLSLKKAVGALVLEVNENSPALSGGVKPGDVIISFNGQDLTAMRQLPRLVADTKAGSTVKLVVWRDDKQVPLNVTIGELDETETAANAEEPESAPAKATDTTEVAGMALAPLTRSLRQQYELEKAVDGVLVVDVTTNGVAAKAGLLPLDVILEANQKAVTTVMAVQTALSDAKASGKSNMLLRVNRQGSVLFLTIPTGK